MRGALAIAIVVGVLHAHAHMQMSWPYPFRSPLDPELSWDIKDYSMTNPLDQTGTNFPCKHYHEDGNSSLITKATYDAGGTYNITLSGSATHHGGSCQVSLSYDNGATFKVIKSVIGGCPLSPSYNFTIPKFAPAHGSVLLSWSWFNLVGNREMYQNCARVGIRSVNTARMTRVHWQACLDRLPDIFVCNVNNGCTTVEGEEVIFPEPGSEVVYG